MAVQIQVGDELLDYTVEIGEIMMDISQAVTHIGIAQKIMTDTDHYEGQASGEMGLFFSSLLEHMNRLEVFYQAALSYVSGVYEEFYYTEAQIQAWIENYFAEMEC